MGWGAKATTAPVSQPSLPRRRKLDVESIPPRAAPYAEADEPDEPVAAPDHNAKAELEWSKLRTKKGWTAETTFMVLYEFVKDTALFPKLVEYGRKRR